MYARKRNGLFKPNDVFGQASTKAGCPVNVRFNREAILFGGPRLQANPLKMADGVGFEPTVGVTHAGFQDRCLKPLGHPSFRSRCGRDTTVADRKSVV